MNLTNKKDYIYNYRIKYIDYFYMLFFLSLCGNVFFTNYITDYIYIFTSCLFLTRYNSIKNNKKILNNISRIIICFILLFFAQYFTFKWNTFPGIINHISKFIIGCGFVILFGNRFKIVLFKTIYIISLISLPLWLLQQVNSGIGGLDWALGKTIWIYCYRTGDDIIRNCGFFWEPGAFAGYIAFLTLIFFNDLNLLVKNHKWECLIIFLALLSTQSTGGYISFMSIILSYLLFVFKSKCKYLILPIITVISLYVYLNTEFLSDKINNQNETTTEQKWGEYSSTRSGSLYFDLYYIAKHPLIGNGLHENTRLADHPVLVKMLKNGELAESGNGFSDTIAKWGLIYIIMFCYIFCKTNQNMTLKKKVIFLLLLCIILQGECFMNYPLFLSIPLIKIS